MNITNITFNKESIYFFNILHFTSGSESFDFDHDETSLESMLL